MSNVENTTSNETASTAPAKNPVQEALARLEKTGKFIVLPTDDEEKGATLGAILAMPENERGFAIKDWTAKAPEAFKGGALVSLENGEYRLVAFADKATALNDPIVQDWAYTRYVGRVIRTARDDEASEAKFVTASGPLDAGLDNSAFAFQAKNVVELLHAQGLKSVQVRTLKTALENSAYAQAMFPTFKHWDRLLEFMAAYAEKHGYSTALFAHWAATRDAKSVDQDAINVTLDNLSLDQFVSAMDSEDESDAKAAAE